MSSSSSSSILIILISSLSRERVYDVCYKNGARKCFSIRDVFKEFVGMCRVLQIQYFFATILFKRCKMHTAICETEIKLKPVKKPM